jgi:hypothetical protein
MNKAWRDKAKSRSNNSIDNNQNICVQAVAIAFKVATKVRYLHCYEDLQRALNSHYSYRSVKSSVKATIGASRPFLVALAKSDPSILAFTVRVEGHVLAISREGLAIVDTAPRKRDRRSIKMIHAIRLKVI